MGYTFKMSASYYSLFEETVTFDLGSIYMSRDWVLQWGIACPPPFAIIFMHYIETKILATAPVAPILWLRYIDDVFGVWRGDLQSLLDFKDLASTIHPNISFTINHTNPIPFLDAEISTNQDGRVCTELYIKPTHSGVLLHYNSAHPKHVKMGVAIGQMRRAVRIANTREGVERGIRKITSMLLANGYPDCMLRKAKRRVFEVKHHRQVDDRGGMDEGVLVLRMPFREGCEPL